MDKVNIGAFIILGVLFISALLIGGTFFYGIFFFVLFLIILSYYSGKKIYRCMECLIWKTDVKVTAGVDMDYSVEIYNSSMFPIPYMEIDTSLPEKLTGEPERCNVRSLAPGGKTRLVRGFTCRHKGVYDLGLVDVTYSDPFSIFTWKKQFSNDISLTVYPRVHPIENIDIPANQLFGTISKKNSAFEDFTSVKDIRKYQYGDSLKKIHWKVSAHKGELYLKNLDMNASTHMHLFLDLCRDNYSGDHSDDIEEKAAEWAASLINFAMSKGIGVNLYAMGKEYINLSDREAGIFETYLDALANLKAEGTVGIVQLIYKEAQKLNNGVTIIVITPSVDSDLIEMAIQLKHKGFQFILFEINDESTKTQEADKIMPNGISYIGIQIHGESDKIVRDRYA